MVTDREAVRACHSFKSGAAFHALILPSADDLKDQYKIDMAWTVFSTTFRRICGQSAVSLERREHV